MVEGKVNEPPPLDNVMVLPAWDIVWKVWAGKVTLFPFEMVSVLPVKFKVCPSVSVSTILGKVTLFPLEIDNTFPAKVKDCASVSVSVRVGNVKDPPPLESVITFPDCDKV